MRETEPIDCTYRESKIYFKELAGAIVGAGTPKSAGQAGRLETEGRDSVAVLSVKAIWRQNLSFLIGPVFSLKALNRLNEAHLIIGQSSVLRVY